MTRFTAASACWLALVGMALTWLSRDGTVDFLAARAFFDPGAGGFYWRSDPLLEQAGHAGLRWLVILGWLIAVVMAAAAPHVASLRSWRGPLAYFSIAIAATNLVTALIKLRSGHSCPSNLEVFGGSAAWFPLFGTPGDDAGPGRCWPGAHAAAGYSLIAGYFALRDRHIGLARVALAVALGLGIVMSVVQMARGAHFFTHNLWSLWFAWLCCVVSYILWQSIGVRR